MVVDTITEWLMNPTFWLVWLGIAVFGYGLVKSMKLDRLPILNNKKTLMWAALIGFVVTSGGFGLLDTGGTASLATVSAVQISDLQVTTAFTSDGGIVPSENTNFDDILDVRMNDANVSETAGQEEVYTGIITVTRTGSLVPTSCTVRAILPPDYEDEDGSNPGLSRNIVEKDSLGVYEVYVQDGAAATINSPQETTALSFGDGVAARTLGVAIEVDEEGHDGLTQYNSKDVIVDVCGKPFTFRIHRMD